MRDNERLPPRSDDTGLLLTSPLVGLGFQTAGALQRLGRRMSALVPDAQTKLLREVPMPIHVYDWETRPATEWGEIPADHNALTALLSPDPELARNETLSAERFERLRELSSRLVGQTPGLNLFVALPWSSSEEQIQRALEFGRSVTVFLTPALYGFRDQNLLDRALEFSETRPAALRTNEAGETPLLSVGDAAAFVASALGRDDLRGRVVWMPAQTESLATWLGEFRVAFGVRESGLFGRLLAGRRRLRDSVALGASRSPRSGSWLATEIFPSPLTPLARSLREMSSHRRRDPAGSLVFPAARGI